MDTVRKHLASMSSQQTCDSSATSRAGNAPQHGEQVQFSVDRHTQNAGIPTFLKDGTQHWLSLFTR
ncbi:MAG TPA: hypothetical protein DER28_07830 [Bifidobacterium sp.]|nr:hypothetical protein [Bifidobacterium sp.]